MIRAYDKSYLSPARTALGRSFDYAVYDQGLTLDDYYALFLVSSYARRFATGDPSVLAGMSGIELARCVMAETSGLVPIRPGNRTGRSPEYWTGWALAYYQWYTAFPLWEIERAIPITRILDLYQPYHEMDISSFVAEMLRLHEAAEPGTPLKRRRMQLGFSQSELARRSGVPLRTIQQYEQRQKDINRASFETVMQLAQALGNSDPRALYDRLSAVRNSTEYESA